MQSELLLLLYLSQMHRALNLVKILLEADPDEVDPREYLRALPEWYAYLYARTRSQGSWRWQKRGISSWIFWPQKWGRQMPHILKKGTLEAARREGALGVTRRSVHYIEDQTFEEACEAVGVDPFQVEIVN